MIEQLSRRLSSYVKKEKELSYWGGSKKLSSGYVNTSELQISSFFAGDSAGDQRSEEEQSGAAGSEYKEQRLRSRWFIYCGVNINRHHLQDHKYQTSILLNIQSTASKGIQFKQVD